MKEIGDLTDIRLLVDAFYDRIQKDDLLGPIFNERITDWTAHMDTMYRFWQSILLNEQVYNRVPFSKHEDLEVNNQHFYRWVTLFNQTVDALFVGPVAEEAKFRALTLAEVFRNKLSSVRF